MIWINLDKLTKKRTFTKNTLHDWYDWLTIFNYIPEPIKILGAALKTKL